MNARGYGNVPQANFSPEQRQGIDEDLPTFGWSNSRGLQPRDIGHIGSDVLSSFKKLFFTTPGYVGVIAKAHGNTEYRKIPHIVWETNLKGLQGIMEDIKPWVRKDLTQDQCIAQAFLLEFYSNMNSNMAQQGGMAAKVGLGLHGVIPNHVAKGGLGNVV
jgi:hypothetical protein